MSISHVQISFICILLLDRSGAATYLCTMTRAKSDEPTLRKLAVEAIPRDRINLDRLRKVVDFARSPLPETARERNADRAFLLALSPVSPQPGHQEPLTDADLAALHREFGEMFRGLVAEPPREFPIPTAYGFLSRSRLGAPIQYSSYGRAVDRVRSAVADLLLSAGENLLACGECGEPFVRERRQLYCSERCSQRVRDRRRRG